MDAIKSQINEQQTQAQDTSNSNSGDHSNNNSSSSTPRSVRKMDEDEIAEEKKILMQERLNSLNSNAATKVTQELESKNDIPMDPLIIQEYINCLNNILTCYINLNNYIKSKEICMRLLQVDSSNRKGLLKMAKISIYFSDYDDAQLCLDRLCVLEPEFSNTSSNISNGNSSTSNNNTTSGSNNSLYKSYIIEKNKLRIAVSNYKKKEKEMSIQMSKRLFKQNSKDVGSGKGDNSTGKDTGKDSSNSGNVKEVEVNKSSCSNSTSTSTDNTKRTIPTSTLTDTPLTDTAPTPIITRLKEEAKVKVEVEPVYNDEVGQFNMDMDINEIDHATDININTDLIVEPTNPNPNSDPNSITLQPKKQTKSNQKLIDRYNYISGVVSVLVVVATIAAFIIIKKENIDLNTLFN